jgi:pimeloyl-ACP methyl ester carboxylesterase
VTRHFTGRIRLARDAQQWAFDRTVKETGKTMHFQGDGRGRLPPSVRSHEMISKHVGQNAQRVERLAAEEEGAGHPETALDLYFAAALGYGQAQHPIFAINAEKRFLHAASLRCYDEVRRLAPYTIEHVDIPWETAAVAGNLHLLPDVATPAPCVFFIPGCDMTKEMYPNPRVNHAHQRGMHLFVFDGPGQGESNLRDLPLRSDNYERAASAAIDALLERPEISEVVVYAMSFGSFWGLRLAATDSRVRAVAAPCASYGDKYYLMVEESPRYRQLFAHLTRAQSEQELDAITAPMTNDGDMARIECPTLLMAGEFDPRSPIDEVYELFDRLRAPGELWVFSDQHHMVSLGASGADMWSQDIHFLGMDWLRDRIQGRPMANAGEVLYVIPGVGGPNGPRTAHRRAWFE